MSEGNPNLSRVITNVVDIQQTIILQFDNLTKSLESLKLDHTSSIKALREDLRRTDDRAQKQIDELKNAHHKEIERLLSIVQTVLAKDAAPAAAPPPQMQIPQIPPALIAQQQQQNAAFQALMMQNHQRQIQEEMQRVQAAHLQAMMNVKPPIVAPPQVAPVAIAKPVVAVPAPPVVPQEVKPAPVAVPAVPKVEEKPKPVVIPPAAPSVPATKPGFTFGTPSGGSIFGKKPETSSPAPAAASGLGLFGKKPDATPATPTVSTTEKDDEDAEDEYEPTVDFKPVIPLPDLVETTTGEEEETVLFNNRAKLYIWADGKEWKERGTGELKILMNNETKKYRVVMRRDQVLKVCANFPIVGQMSIQQMATNEKAYTWFCEDFSEDEPENVKLSARFGSAEIAKNFKSLFEKAIAEYVKLDKTPTKSSTIDKEIKPADKKEESTSAGKPVEIPTNKENVGFGDKFKPEEGSWSCQACYATVPPGHNECKCCGSGRDGKPAEKKDIFSKPIMQPQAGTPKFTFGMSAAAAAKEPSVAQVKSPQFEAGLSTTPGSTGGGALFGTGTAGTTPKPSIFGGGAPAASTNGTTPKFSFGKTVTPAAASSPAASSPAPSTGSSLFGGSAAPKPTFSFNQQAAEPTKTPNFSFNNTNVSLSETRDSTASETPKSIFGNFGAGETFASLSAKAKENNIFEGEAARKAQEEFKAQKKSTSLFNKNNESTAGGDETDEEGTEYEPQVDFKPVIPLPDLVEVKTGEEDEDVLFQARCKLYRYVKESKENKERGVGDVKILHNKETGCYRVVMRREQVHKLCANFRIAKGIDMKGKVGLPNVCTLQCLDFAENTTEGMHEIFSFKFKEEKTALAFRDKFNEVKESC